MGIELLFRIRRVEGRGRGRAKHPRVTRSWACAARNGSGAGFVIGAICDVGLPCRRKQRSMQMKTILIAVAVLGLTASAALAECAYHTTHNTTTTTDEAKPTTATQ